MNSLFWILAASIVLSLISLVGGIALLVRESTLRRLLFPMISLSAGALLGGAFFHLIPSALEQMGSATVVMILVLAGFSVFFALEQFLHWHHCHRHSIGCKKPMTYLILVGDTLHNFLDGIAVAGAFITDIRLGLTTCLATAAHEIPQELGDFGVLVHGGWEKRKALLFNFLSSLTFWIGAVLTWAASLRMDISFLIPFAAGNLLYIGASDLVPEIARHENAGANIVHYVCFLAGLGLLLAVKLLEP
jgi:zinc and cadmium transporter